MRLFFALAMCLAGSLNHVLADGAKQVEPKIVGKVDIVDQKTADEIAKAIVAGICTYHNGRIVCPLDKENVALAINAKSPL